MRTLQVRFVGEVLHKEPSAEDLELIQQRSMPIPGVKIKKITDRRHPCHGQFGLFATRAFAESEKVGMYTGLVKPRASGEVDARKGNRGGTRVERPRLCG